MFHIIIDMYALWLFLIFLIVVYITSRTYEGYKTWDYEFSLSDKIFKDMCPIQGSIEEIDNPSMDACFRGYYIPYLYDVGTYYSEVQPQF